MSAKKLKLDFVVLGAQKAGTTSLHELLARHPEIALPVDKETHFFSHRDRAALGSTWYLSQFRKTRATKFVGEVDPEYMFSVDAPAAMSALTTVSKFVIILRHPLERAYSQYQMSMRRGYEEAEFGIALASEQSRLQGPNAQFALDHWSYTARSMYAHQIQRYFRAFPTASFLFLRSDTISSEGYKRVCKFIGTEPLQYSSSELVHSHRASDPRSLLIRNLLYAPKGKSDFRRIFVRIFPAALKARLFVWLDRVNQRPRQQKNRPNFGEIPRSILTAMSDDLDKTEALTNLDLSDWRQQMQFLNENSQC